MGGDYGNKTQAAQFKWSLLGARKIKCQMNKQGKWFEICIWINEKKNTILHCCGTKMHCCALGQSLDLWLDSFHHLHDSWLVKHFHDCETFFFTSQERRHRGSSWICEIQSLCVPACLSGSFCFFLTPPLHINPFVYCLSCILLTQLVLNVILSLGFGITWVKFRHWGRGN